MWNKKEVYRKLSKVEMKLKVRGLIDIKNILESIGIDYFFGGNVLLGIIREGNIINTPFGTSTAMRYEDYAIHRDKIVDILTKKGFIVKINKNKFAKKEKIKAVKHGFLYEVTPWYLKNGIRSRAKFKLLNKFFESGHYEKLGGVDVQTFNYPFEYLVFRYGENWKTPIQSMNRKDYENPGYYK